MKVSTIQYARTLLELTENKSQEEILVVVKKFAEILKENGQIKNTARIMEKYAELYNAAHGIVVAEVVTGSDMGQETSDKVRKFIAEKYNVKDVEMNVVVDEKIQGGIIIKVGDEILDGSVSGQLKKLKNILSK